MLTSALTILRDASAVVGFCVILFVALSVLNKVALWLLDPPAERIRWAAAEAERRASLEERLAKIRRGELLVPPGEW